MMSKAVITMTDSDSGIDVRLEFDPPIGSSERVSGAQWLAGEILKIASKILEQVESDDE
jgi:hypothetical protein